MYHKSKASLTVICHPEGYLSHCVPHWKTQHSTHTLRVYSYEPLLASRLMGSALIFLCVCVFCITQIADRVVFFFPWVCTLNAHCPVDHVTACLEFHLWVLLKFKTLLATQLNSILLELHDGSAWKPRERTPTRPRHSTTPPPPPFPIIPGLRRKTLPLIPPHSELWSIWMINRRQSGRQWLSQRILGCNEQHQ